MVDPAFKRGVNPIQNLSPFVLLFRFMVFLQVSGRVFFYMLRMMNIGFIRFHFNVHKITQANPEVVWQGRTDFPMIPLYIKVDFSPIIIIY